MIDNRGKASLDLNFTITASMIQWVLQELSQLRRSLKSGDHDQALTKLEQIASNLEHFLHEAGSQTKP